MLEPLSYRPLDYTQMGGLLFRGGTILGTSNKGRFAAKTGHGEVRRVPEEILGEAKRNFDALGLRALVCIGGDGSLTIAQQLYETGVPVVGVPKTIDNDLDATLMTFGFETAVTCAVDALDRLHSTAESHDRVMVLEVMGGYAGLDRRLGRPGRRRRRDPDPGDRVQLRLDRGEDPGAGGAGQALHHRDRRRGRAPGRRRVSSTAGEAGGNREARLGGIGQSGGGRARGSARARSAARWCWAICSAAARPPRGTATCARVSASARSS